MGFYLLDNSSVNGTQWQQWTYPRRGASLSGTCIIHTAESVLDNVGPDAGAEDCAAFIARRTGSYGSYHTLVDSDSIIELAPYEYETWQDSETNNWAVGLSAACRTTDWATMGEAKREGYYRNLAWAAADFVKYMKEAYEINVPRRRISGQEARNRVPGFAAHGDSGIARSDPGRDFDWNRFFRYIDEELKGESVSTPEQIAAAVWGYKNGQDKDAYARLNDIADGNILMTNQYGTKLSIPDQLGWIDKNLNDARDMLHSAISGIKVDVELSDEQVTNLAESLKNTLAPGVVSVLADKLSK